ncbi:MAG: flagellar basal body P-ring protein FlgI [Sedimentisphaerales bacterium]|nr:flagellar basal body P-ring protein FlgI [Sedimentisphaerales bacterium]
MKNITGKIVFLITVVLAGCLVVGCDKGVGTDKGTRDLISTGDLGVTIGSLVNMSWPESVRLEGYGLVVGLKDTGSVECPQHIRTYLGQHLQTLFPNRRIDAAQFMGGLDTAVVLVEGVMPTIASKNEDFDVRVSALNGTQTTSLEGGWLLGTELKPVGTFGLATKIVGNAKGTVYLDKLEVSTTNKRVGYILAGGKVLDEYKVAIKLKQADFRTTNIIRNRLNELFGDVMAKVVLPGVLDVSVPAKYEKQKRRFISIIDKTYLAYNPAIVDERIEVFTRKLAALQDADASEIALEAIGNQSLKGLSPLLASGNEEVRLRAARCMLNLGSEAGLETLRQMALDGNCLYRFTALESISAAARRNDTIRISQRLLRDDDIRMRLLAYEQLRKLEDVSVLQELVGNNFYLEQIAQTPRKAIFVCRSGQPRVVLFGAPIECSEGTYVRSTDGDITINAPSGQSYVSVIRKHPRRDGVVLQLKSSFVLSDIIQTLCGEPKEEGKPGKGGLGVPYSDVIALLKQMCDKGAVKAEFWAGALPKIG